MVDGPAIKHPCHQLSRSHDNWREGNEDESSPIHLNTAIQTPPDVTGGVRRVFRTSLSDDSDQRVHGYIVFPSVSLYNNATIQASELKK